MVPSLRLRPASNRDYMLALTLFLDGTRPLLEDLGRWDEVTVKRRFSNAFRPSEAQIICIESDEVGWLQVACLENAIHLKQIHVAPAFRGKGIGSHLIRSLMQRAIEQTRPMTLNVIRGNRAIGLYERLGFRIVGEDDDKYHMVWPLEIAHETSLEGGSHCDTSTA